MKLVRFGDGNGGSGMLQHTVFAGMLFVASVSSAQAQPKPDLPQGPVRIGVLGDMSGFNADVSGKGSLEAVRMATEDFGGSVLGKPIEVVSADHQNKPDIAAGIARNWFDNDKVDVVTDVVGSAATLAVMAVGSERKKIVLATNAASGEINGRLCNPYTVQYRSDTYAEAKSTAKGLLAQGGDTWFIVGADYIFGHTLASDLTDVVTSSGGKVLGSVFHPSNTSDLSSYILQAQASGAKVIAFANAGYDMVNSLKTASEFGLGVKGQQRVTGMLVYLTDIDSVGLPITQGLTLEADFYWNTDEQTRAFAQRYIERVGKMPTMVHAAAYSAVLTYLKAVQAAGTDDSDTVMAQMKKMPINDLYAHNAYIRPDGLLIHDLSMFQVKSPAESIGRWDDYKLLSTIAGNDAFRPLAESACPLIRHY